MDHEMEIADNPLARSTSPYLDFYDLVVRAVAWVREKYIVGKDETVADYFEKEFNCVVIFYEDPRQSPTIVFNNKEALTWFIMRWS